MLINGIGRGTHVATRHIISDCESSTVFTSAVEQGCEGSYKNTECGQDLAAATPKITSTESLAGASPEPIQTQASTLYSFDSDLFSISSSMDVESFEQLQFDHVHLSIIRTVVGKLLDGYQGIRNRVSQPSDVDSTKDSNGTTGTPPHSLHTSISDETQDWRKRKTADDELDEDGFRKPPIKSRKLKHKPERKFLACPFWKRNPTKHRRCFSLALHGISRVKQHLTRTHTLLFFCLRCRGIFPDRNAREVHVMQDKSCVPDPSATLDGILPEQQLELHRKSDHKLSEAQQWFKIWDIVFPGRGQPCSPYIDSQLSEDCSLLRDYCLDNGPDFFSETLESTGMVLMDEEERSRTLRHIMSETFVAFIDSWIQSRSTSLEPRSSNSNWGWTFGSLSSATDATLNSSEGTYETRTSSMFNNESSSQLFAVGEPLSTQRHIPADQRPAAFLEISVEGITRHHDNETARDIVDQVPSNGMMQAPRSQDPMESVPLGSLDTHAGLGLSWMEDMDMQFPYLGFDPSFDGNAL
ncbi:hypothetical protein GQ53DRAFT_348418 [Thozetella sp. PMI_491]|nr:hypothetical protein GQ53DRAFT_348418 [Thozetella sp. PMI_491]